MWYAAMIRFVRRRLVLGLVFASSLTYCVVSLMRESAHTSHSEGQDVSVERRHPFIWRSLQEHNETAGAPCRNSMQGKLLIVDDRGYICQRNNLLRSGCCDTETETTKRYCCDTCDESRCCAIFEYCVSCCLHPNKKDILEVVLSKLSAQANVLFNTVGDHYELCLAKCRTNSLSVRHENSYRDPRLKHCYGEAVPATHNVLHS